MRISVAHTVVAHTAVAVATLVILLVVQPVFADDDRPMRTLSTSGTATLRVKPDSVRIFFKVTKAAATVAEVRAANVQSTNAVMENLERLEIKNMFTKTSTVHVEIVWADYPNQLEVRGYRMMNVFTVRVVNENVDKLAEEAAKVVDVALEAGANEISNIVFFKEDDEADRLECLQKAIAQAKVTAQAMAEAASVKLGDPISVSGEPQYYYPEYAHYQTMAQTAMPAGGAGEASSYSPGDVELRCSAHLTFEIEP